MNRPNPGPRAAACLFVAGACIAADNFTQAEAELDKAARWAKLANQIPNAALLRDLGTEVRAFEAAPLNWESYRSRLTAELVYGPAEAYGRAA